MNDDVTMSVDFLRGEIVTIAEAVLTAAKAMDPLLLTSMDEQTITRISENYADRHIKTLFNDNKSLNQDHQ